jgi:hypothetical protein
LKIERRFSDPITASKGNVDYWNRELAPATIGALCNWHKTVIAPGGDITFKTQFAVRCILSRPDEVGSGDQSPIVANLAVRTGSLA